MRNDLVKKAVADFFKEYPLKNAKIGTSMSAPGWQKQNVPELTPEERREFNVQIDRQIMAKKTEGVVRLEEALENVNNFKGKMAKPFGKKEKSRPGARLESLLGEGWDEEFATIKLNGLKSYVKSYDDGIHFALARHDTPSSKVNPSFGTAFHIAQVKNPKVKQVLQSWLKDPQARDLGTFDSL